MLQSYVYAALFLQDTIFLEIRFFILRFFREMQNWFQKYFFEVSAVTITNRFLLLGIWTCMASNKGVYVLAIDF